MSVRKFYLLSVCFLILALFLRSYQISTRPLHSDEGVNYLFLKQVAEKSYYPYSHVNYHGPSFFYSAALAIKIFGINDFGMRVTSIFYGMLCLILIILFAKSKGFSFSAITLALMSVSSSLIFHSRYAIHEMLFVFATLWLFYHSYLWCKEHDKRHIYGFFMALVCLIATKETFVINLFCLGLAGLFFGDLKKHFSFLQKQLVHLQYAFLVFLVFLFGIFTGGFRWFQGVREMFMAVQQWIGRGVESDTGHFKPYYYYVKDVILVAEPHLVLALVISIIVVFSSILARVVKKENAYFSLILSDSLRLLRVLSAWAFSVTLFYSLVPYKTVWLVINMTLPLTLVLAASLSLLFKTRFKLLSFLLVLTLTCLSYERAWTYNFKVPYGPDNPYSYVHTSPGMLEMLDDVESYWQHSPDASVLIGVNSYWPLPYYFRGRENKLGYLKTKEPQKYAKEYQVIIVDKTVHYEAPGWQKKYYRLSDVQEANVYFRY